MRLHPVGRHRKLGPKDWVGESMPIGDRAAVLAIALFQALAPRVGAAAEPASARAAIVAPPEVHPDDPLRFAIAGRTWFPAGYYPSLGTFSARKGVESRYFVEYLDRLAANGLNYTRMVFTMGQGSVDASFPYERVGFRRAADGGRRFDLTRFDERHFDYWREVIAYAQSKGVVVQLVILDAWHNRYWLVGQPGRTEWGMKHDFFGGRNNVNGVDATSFPEWIATRGSVFEAQVALVEKVVDELGGFPNIVWEVANEATVAGGAAADAWQDALAGVIGRREAANGYPRHLVMPRDLPNHERVAHDRPGMLENRSFGRPLLIDNDFGTEVWTPAFRRRKAWAALTSGAHINFFHFPMHDPAVLQSEDVALGMKHVGNTRRFLELLDIDLAGMAPCDDLVSVGWCYGRAGEELIVYLPEGGAVGVEALPEDFEARWFDPREGRLHMAPSGPPFEAPGGGDWVLYIAAGG
jgi:hypothetical protein